MSDKKPLYMQVIDKLRERISLEILNMMFRL